MNEKRCCGNCRYHQNIAGEWVCTCGDSEAWGLETDFDDDCDYCENLANKSQALF